MNCEHENAWSIHTAAADWCPSCGALRLDRIGRTTGASYRDGWRLPDLIDPIEDPMFRMRGAEALRERKGRALKFAARTGEAQRLVLQWQHEGDDRHLTGRVLLWLVSWFFLACGTGAASLDGPEPRDAGATHEAASPTPNDAGGTAERHDAGDATTIAPSDGDTGADASDAAHEYCPPATDPCDCRTALGMCAGYTCGVASTCMGPFWYALGGNPAQHPDIGCYVEHRIGGVDGCDLTDAGAAWCCNGTGQTP